MATFLPPIENPSSPMLKLVYAMSRRQFGKVMTPFKVFVARMPLAFGMFTGKIGKLDKKLELPRETQMLVRERVARINVCEFCIDIGRSFVIKALNERSQVRCAGGLRHESDVFRCRAGVAGLRDRVDARKEREGRDFCAAQRSTIPSGPFARLCGWWRASIFTT